MMPPILDAGCWLVLAADADPKANQFHDFLESDRGVSRTCLPLPKRLSSGAGISSRMRESLKEIYDNVFSNFFAVLGITILVIRSRCLKPHWCVGFQGRWVMRKKDRDDGRKACGGNHGIIHDRETTVTFSKASGGLYCLPEYSIQEFRD